MKPTTARRISPIPTLFTSTNLILSSVGIALLFDRRAEGLVPAAILIVVAAIMDSFDGRVARATNSCTTFGMELDSMADLVSFGVAPAWLAYVFALSSLGILGLAVAIGWTLCVAWRLARYNANVQNKMGSFMGLPCPPAAATVAAYVLLVAGGAPEGAMAEGWRQEQAAPVLALGMAGLAWLMISRTPFVPVLKLGWFTLKLQLVAAAVLIATGLATGTAQRMLFGILLVYTLSGPALRAVSALGPAPARRLAGSRQTAAPTKPNR